MTAYNEKAFRKFIEYARKEGHKSIEVIIAKYEGAPPLTSKKYHHNIVLLAGKRKERVYDLISKIDPDENDGLALAKATSIVDRLKINGLNVAAVQLKPAKYSWFFDELTLNQSNK